MAKATGFNTAFGWSDVKAIPKALGQHAYHIGGPNDSSPSPMGGVMRSTPGTHRVQVRRRMTGMPEDPSRAAINSQMMPPDTAAREAQLEGAFYTGAPLRRIRR